METEVVVLATALELEEDDMLLLATILELDELGEP